MKSLGIKKDDKEAASRQLNTIYRSNSKYWEKRQKNKIFNFFHYCASNVSGYKNFLKDNGIIAKNITTFESLSSIPPIGRKNYLERYEWKDLCLLNCFNNESLVVTSTSGSSGRPFYFPRNNHIDFQSSVCHEIFLRNSHIDPKKTTLVLVCFGMGAWIGGVITYQAFKLVSERGYPLTILTPGVNKREIFEALKSVGRYYEQIIICGYPPFMKDIVDEAKDNGVNWRDYNLKIIFAAESFSEKFRDYIVRKTGINDIYRDTMNIYGSADLGTMAQETPIAILVRRMALANKNIYKKLFKDAVRLPTLAQYVPDFINFESSNGSIYCTGENSLPLFRYEIGDNGGVINFDTVKNIFRDEGINLIAEANKAGIKDTIAELPFVYIYERTDLSTKLYGAIIYPEYIKAGLDNNVLDKYITGKFTMLTKFDKKQDEYLEINVELKPFITEPDWLAKKVTESITESLTERSAEYSNNVNMVAEKVKPRLVFWPHEHPTHFKVGVKQKWVKKAAL